MKDHLGNIRQTISQSGSIVAAQDYYCYGELIRSYNQGLSNERYKFTGKESDNESNYDYFGARYYDSQIGRWLEVDPMRDKYPGWSSYNYVMDNPERNIDILGKWPWDKIVNMTNNLITLVSLKLKEFSEKLYNGERLSIRDDKITAGRVVNLKVLVNINANYNGNEALYKSADKVDKIAGNVGFTSRTLEMFFAPAENVSLTLGAIGASADATSVGAQLTKGIAKKDMGIFSQAGMNAVMMYGSEKTVDELIKSAPESSKAIKNVVGPTLDNVSNSVNLLIDESRKHNNQ